MYKVKKLNQVSQKHTHTRARAHVHAHTLKIYILKSQYKNQFKFQIATF